LYRLVSSFYEEVKGCWEECFERIYGRWRGFLDRVVEAYVDCGNYACGFARVRCPKCSAEYLVAFSCQTRSFCPSCAAKRAAIFGAHVVEEVAAEVGHAQWVSAYPPEFRGPPTSSQHLTLPAALCRVLL
jgi:ribosomal protein S27E